jgi:hypothetical protein
MTFYQDLTFESTGIPKLKLAVIERLEPAGT